MGQAARLPQVIAMVAGGFSGDQLGAHLMRSLVSREPRLKFIGIGGPKMEAAGAQILYPTERLAFRADAGVLKNAWEIAGIRRRLRNHLLRDPPALFIGVGAPDFNIDLEIELKQAGIATVQYVSPAVWPWGRERIEEVKQAVSLMLTVFPFEAPRYEQAGVPLAYVGHPLADLLADLPAPHAVRDELRVPLDVPVVALLPGSRVSGVENMADLFIRAAMKVSERVPDVRFLVPFASLETKAVFEAALLGARSENLTLTLMIGHSLEAMAAADVVLVASGTASVEAALLKRPMVITYRTPPMPWWLSRRRPYPPLAGLPNILAGRKIVPELLQEAATPDALADALVAVLADPDAGVKLDGHFEAIRAALRQNAAEKVAAAVTPLLAPVSERSSPRRPRL